jgi:hypothetical protein
MPKGPQGSMSLFWRLFFRIFLVAGALLIAAVTVNWVTKGVPTVSASGWAERIFGVLVMLIAASLAAAKLQILQMEGANREADRAKNP